MAGVWDAWSDMRPEPETEPLKPEKEGGTQRPRRRNLAATVGIALMGLSLALWVSLPAVPFLPLSVGGRATFAATLVVVAEVAFWLGAAMAGPEAARRMRSWWRSPKRGKAG